MHYTSTEPSPKMAVRIGSEKKVMMVSSTATPAEVLKTVTAAFFMVIFVAYICTQSFSCSQAIQVIDKH